MAKLDHICAGFFPLASICFYIAVDLKSEVKCEVVVSGWLASLDDYASFQAFSAFFVCATATTDLICFVLLPVQLLLFLASTYVWVQFVWHTGIILVSFFCYLVRWLKLLMDFAEFAAKDDGGDVIVIMVTSTVFMLRTYTFRC